MFCLLITTCLLDLLTSALHILPNIWIMLNPLWISLTRLVNRYFLRPFHLECLRKSHRLKWTTWGCFVKHTVHRFSVVWICHVTIWWSTTTRRLFAHSGPWQGLTSLLVVLEMIILLLQLWLILTGIDIYFLKASLFVKSRYIFLWVWLHIF